MARPLEGTRVVNWTQWHVGRIARMMLGGLDGRALEFRKKPTNLG
jgi:hypothetical protein